MYNLQPRRGDIHRACCGLSGIGRAVGEALVEALVGRTPLLNLTCFLLATLCHACAHFGDGPGFCRRVHPVAQGSARSAPTACNLPPRARPTTTTSQFGRRYFDGSYLKEKRVCPASDTRHLSLFDAPHGPASRLHLPPAPPPPASTSAPPPPASTSASASASRLHLPPPPPASTSPHPHPHLPPFSVWPLSVLALCAAGGVLAKETRGRRTLCRPNEHPWHPKWVFHQRVLELAWDLV